MTSDLQAKVQEILHSHRLSRRDQQYLMGLLLSQETISVEDNALVNQIFEAVRQGLVRIVD